MFINCLLLSSSVIFIYTLFDIRILSVCHCVSLYFCVAVYCIFFTESRVEGHLRCSKFSGSLCRQKFSVQVVSILESITPYCAILYKRLWYWAKVAQWHDVCRKPPDQSWKCRARSIFISRVQDHMVAQDSRDISSHVGQPLAVEFLPDPWVRSCSVSGIICRGRNRCQPSKIAKTCLWAVILHPCVVQSNFCRNLWSG